ncbi:MAG: dephospho-CoA kinase [Ferruginibacter sp.]
MILRVGITGGMGSGKTTVSKIFEVLGIPVYYADIAAKRLMNEDEKLKSALKKTFGEDTFINGTLNRKYLSSIVFNDAEKLSILNSMVHPATLRDTEQWMLQQTSTYAIKEAALIFESGAQQQLDYVIGVHAPESLRIQRAMKRDHISQEEVTLRMEKQIDEDIKMRLCDYIIVNDEQQLVIPQVLKLHEIFISMKP